jgi:hypothetical protein
MSQNKGSNPSKGKKTLRQVAQRINLGEYNVQDVNECIFWVPA